MGPGPGAIGLELEEGSEGTAVTVEDRNQGCGTVDSSGMSGAYAATGSTLRLRDVGPAPKPFPTKPIPPKLYRIGEIVDYTRVSRQTIHNYTTMGLITESRRSIGGHRLYAESVFARLDQIAEMKRQRLTMREIRTHFERLDVGLPDRG